MSSLLPVSLVLILPTGEMYHVTPLLKSLKFLPVSTGLSPDTICLFGDSSCPCPPWLLAGPEDTTLCNLPDSARAALVPQTAFPWVPTLELPLKPSFFPLWAVAQLGGSDSWSWSRATEVPVLVLPPSGCVIGPHTLQLTLLISEAKVSKVSTL